MPARTTAAQSREPPVQPWARPGGVERSHERYLGRIAARLRDPAVFGTDVATWNASDLIATREGLMLDAIHSTARMLLAATMLTGLCAGGARAEDAPSVSLAGNLRVECRGHGVPTVVVPAGSTRGWSDDGLVRVRRLCVFGTVTRRAPGASGDPAQALHTALIEAGADAPWLVLGASAPDDLLDAFALRFADELAGVVRLPAHGRGTNVPAL